MNDEIDELNQKNQTDLTNLEEEYRKTIEQATHEYECKHNNFIKTIHFKWYKKLKL